MKSVRAYHGAYGAILENYALDDEQLQRDLNFLAEADDEILGFYSVIVEGEPELDLMFVADGAQGTASARARQGETVHVNLQLAVASVQTDVQVGVDAPGADKEQAAAKRKLCLWAGLGFCKPFGCYDDAGLGSEST